MSTNNAGATPTTGVTPYTNSSIGNTKEWERTLFSKLDNHADKLVTIVREGKLDLGIKLKLKATYKSLTETFDADAEKAHVKSLNKTAYYILIASIKDPTTLSTLTSPFATLACTTQLVNFSMPHLAYAQA